MILKKSKSIVPILVVLAITGWSSISISHALDIPAQDKNGTSNSTHKSDDHDPTTTPSQRGARVQRIGEILDAYHSVDSFNGVALVAESGNIIFHKAYGPANIEHGVPNTLRTRFRIASQTKIFTVILMLQLVEEGLVELDEPIGAYLSIVRPDIATRVTARHLLEHRSGIERYYLPDEHDYSREFTTSDLLEAINENVEWEDSPGASVAYSNAGYVLLAAIIESVTDKPYALVLQERILTPLEMHDTGVEDQVTEIIPRMATGYRLRMGLYIHADRIGMSWVRGNGGIYSTAEDMFKFESAIRNRTLLSKAHHEYLFQKGEDTFALGWQVTANHDGFPKNTGGLAWARGANTGGFRMQWTRQLDGGRVVMLFVNLDDSPRMEISQKIFHALEGNDVTLPNQSPGDIVLESFRTQGAVEAKKVVERLTRDQQTAAVYEFLEYGHHLIRANRAIEAIDIFTFCDKVSSDSPDILSSLAYAHLKSGNKDLAATLAQQALVAFPGNADALEVLTESKKRP